MQYLPRLGALMLVLITGIGAFLGARATVDIAHGVLFYALMFICMVCAVGCQVILMSFLEDN